MDKKKITSIIIMIVGLATLVTGAVFLILRLNAGPGTSDGEYLVSAGEWILDNDTSCKKQDESTEETESEPKESQDEAKEDSIPKIDCESSVIWKFTEIGKGTLTTNAHTNDYDFQWAIEDGKLKIRTNWLYELDDEYEYRLNQGDGILTLKTDEKEYRFASQQ